MELRAWQSVCLDLWAERGHRGLVEVITGAGKTVMALEGARRLAEKVPSLSTIVLVPRIPLASQWRDAAIRFGFAVSDIAIVGGGGLKRLPQRRLVIIVVNTAWTVLPQSTLFRPLLLIADEFHHYASRESMKMLMRIMGSVDYTLGLSATAGKKWILEKLTPFFGEVFYTYDADAAIAHGVISGYDIMNVATHLNGEEYQRYLEVSDGISKRLMVLCNRHPHLMRDDSIPIEVKLHMLMNNGNEDDAEDAKALTMLLFQRRSIISRSDERLGACIAIMRRLRSGRRTIVFAESIEQINILEEKLAAVGITQVAKYHSRMAEVERKDALIAFKGGEKSILLSCKALEEGFDVPDADVGIFLSNSDSERQRIQRLGRLLRKSGDKERSMLYYIYAENTVERHTLIEHNPESTREKFVRFAEGRIDNEDYNKLARQLIKLSAAKQDGKTARIHRSLVWGSILLDYMRSMEDLAMKASSAKDADDRDYYRTMQMLVQLKRLNAAQSEEKVESSPPEPVEEVSIVVEEIDGTEYIGRARKSHNGRRRGPGPGRRNS